MRHLWIAVTALLLASPAYAVTIPIPNSGFESPSFADGGFQWGLYPGGSVIGGWTTAGGVGFAAGIQNPTTTTFSGEAPGGENVAFLITYNTAWLIQTLTTTYVEGETYTLTALVGDGDVTHFFDYTIGLYVAGSVKSTMTLSPIPADDSFALASATVVADASMDGQPIEVRMGSFSTKLVDDPDNPGNDRAVYFDNLQLTTTAIPTPSALVAMIPGLLILSRRRQCS